MIIMMIIIDGHEDNPVQAPHFSVEKKSDCIGLPLGSKFHKIQVLAASAKPPYNMSKTNVAPW